MMFMEVAPPLFVGTILTAGLWLARSQARRKNLVRARQMRESAALLGVHAQTLDRFLSAEVAPDALKRVLINYSDAMSDKAAVLKVAEWMSSQPMESIRVELEPQDDEIRDEIAQLRKCQPDLMDDLARAILTVTIGSVLRWPESAALIEQVGARMAVSPGGNVALAVKAVGFRTGQSFGLGKRAPAMA